MSFFDPANGNYGVESAPEFSESALYTCPSCGGNGRSLTPDPVCEGAAVGHRRTTMRYVPNQGALPTAGLIVDGEVT